MALFSKSKTYDWALRQQKKDPEKKFANTIILGIEWHPYRVLN